MRATESNYRIAMAAGQDAGDKSAREAGRIEWNESDWNVAADTVAKLMDGEVARK